MTASTLTGRYGDMHRLTQQMLEAARQGDWDRLVILEASRAGIEQALRAAAEPSPAGADGVALARTIQAILDADSEIRTLAQAWMIELRKRAGSLETEQKLAKAYEAF